MWQNLRNVRSMAEKIGNVVAPVQDGDEYYEEDEDDGVEYYSEDEEEEEFDEEEEEPLPPRSPFGIVGMFARVMDQEQEEYEEEVGMQARNDETSEELQVAAPSNMNTERSDPIEVENNMLEESHQREETNIDTVLPNNDPPPTLQAAPTHELPITSTITTEQSFTPEPESLHPPDSPQDPPKMLGLMQRESGSLSPMSPNKKFSSLTQTESEPLNLVAASDGPPHGNSITIDSTAITSKDPVIEESCQVSSHENIVDTATETLPDTTIPQKVERNQSTTSLESSSVSRSERLEKRCKELNRKLRDAEREIESLRSAVPQLDHEQLYQSFQQKEARLLEAANEEHELEMNRLRQEMDDRNARFQTDMLEERKAFRDENDQLKSLLKEANSKMKALEIQNQEMVKKLEQTQTNQEHQHVRALRKVEDRLAQTLAVVDEKDERISQLQRNIKELESRISSDQDGAAEAEEEMDELHQENEVLHGQIEDYQAENDALRARLAAMEQDSDELVQLKMELRLLKEDHNRVQTKAENLAASAQSDTAKLAQDRDEALVEVKDLQLRLSSAIADLEIVKADSERLVLSNENLQGALEAFQAEREAEMAMIEEQKVEETKALNASHVAEMEALKLVHKNEVRQIQKAADDAVRNTMEEVKKLEEKVEKFRMESVQTRRSLDEAIERLSQTQDDVVDRTVMKNILLDWLTKSGKKERNQVLEMMVDLLHFTDDEKRRVNIDGRSPSIRNIMSPPPAKVDVKNLEGENVREKWVNFLLAETSDD